MKPNPQPQEEDDIVGPAIVRDDHVQDRTLSKEAGSKAGWSRLTVFERSHRAGKLMDKERCTGDTPAKIESATRAEAQRAIDRYDAGKHFAECWLIANTTNWGCASDFNRVRVLGVAGSFVDHQIDVKDFMRALEKRLGTRDWMILRRVCGENYPIAETVTDITPGYRASTLARFREALDALVDAIPLAQKDMRKR